MSDFSSKCREYLKNTGETVYQLSASSGLDRTSLQRMITGKRLPGMDFVRQFCDSIRINPSQRQELIELYKIEKIGKEIYYNRKYIQELLRVISTQQMLFSSGFHSLTSLPFYSGDFSLDVEKKVLTFLKISCSPVPTKRSAPTFLQTVGLLYKFLHISIRNIKSFLLLSRFFRFTRILPHHRTII